jgi:tetratricopeptide (TPR) repeat protein
VFFERFREAVARLPAGLLRPGPAADALAVEAAARALGRPLPDDYASFLRSFDGADLFHESVVIAGVGAQSPLRLPDLNPQSPAPEVAFAETAAGDRFVFAEKPGAVYRVRAGSEERVLAGSDFTRWLDATVAREQILYGADGEFAPEVFEDDGEEIQPRIALRQAERALRVDAGSAEAHCDRGIALRRLGRLDEAADAFARAAELDTGNPWPWFDLGRAALPHDPRRAADAFRRAAEAEGGPSGARMLAWAAHAAALANDDAAAAEARAAALARQPGLLEDLRRAVATAVEEQDPEAAQQAALLVEAIAPTAPVRRLPLAKEPPARAVTERPARRPPPARPPRPRRATPPPAGASPRGRRR